MNSSIKLPTTRELVRRPKAGALDRERQLRLGAAIERACVDLPPGCDITLYIENGYAGAKLTGPNDDDATDLDSPDERDLGREIEAGISTAQASIPSPAKDTP